MAIVIGVSGMFMIGASNVIIIKDGDKSIHLTSYKSELTDIIKVAGITLEEDDELSVSKEGKYKIINIINIIHFIFSIYF